MKHHKFGARSLAKLSSCNFKLAQLMNGAILLSPVDITIIEGFRSDTQQDHLFAKGLSKKRGGESLHNHMSRQGNPNSLAVDFAPWVNGGVDWNDTHMFAVVAGVIHAVAIDLDVKCRWGGDWDRDGSTTDQTFMDWGHIELVREIDP